MLRKFTETEGVALVRGYADDIAVLVADFGALVEIFELFDMFGLASGLRLNFSKCVLVPLALTENPEYDIKVFRALAKQNLPSEVATKLRINHSAKYLGSWFGPQAEEVSWKAPTTKYWHRVLEINSDPAAATPRERLLAYNERCAPIFSYAHQLEVP